MHLASQHDDQVAHKYSTSSAAHTLHAELLHDSQEAHASGGKVKTDPKDHHLSEEWNV